jgi:alkanesulfonate monooxygenase SsuD/methylene tetrahydromethanopterin reductase-like flavin-dependent oxidoreductase (luciferase family)
MHYGIEVVPFGAYSNPRQVVQLAQAAEAAGWEALWIWDHMLMPYGAGDPWITLAAVAASTQRLKLITGVAPVPRYRPHLLARMLAGLDLLSEGRVIFGTGLGIAPDFEPFGEPVDARTRASMLDEGLEQITRLWTGEPTLYLGRYYRAEQAQLLPTPVQQPRIPIWIGGASKAALRRAARWDGWIMGTVNEQCEVTQTPEQIAAQVAVILQHRARDAGSAPFDVAVDGVSASPQRSRAADYAQAGATWWFECLFGSRGSHEDLLRRIQAGPPLSL